MEKKITRGERLPSAKRDMSASSTGTAIISAISSMNFFSY